MVITYAQLSSETAADNVITKINALKNGSAAIKVQAQLRDIDAPGKIVHASRQAFGDYIDILVNNAGTGIVKTLMESTPEDYHFILDLNLRSVFFMIKAVVPYLRSPGRIINISSVGARSGFRNISLYCASKAAVEGLTRSLADELGPNGHTVNAVEPGPVQTELVQSLPKDFVDLQMSLTPMEHRMGTIDDIAQVVVFLAEERSRWITGQSISASGGRAMY